MDNPTNQVNLNTASRDELMSLPGVSGALADRIVKARPFTSIEDLKQVKKLPHSTLKTLLPLVYVGDAPPALAEGAEQTSLPALLEAAPPGEETGAPVVELPVENQVVEETVEAPPEVVLPAGLDALGASPGADRSDPFPTSAPETALPRETGGSRPLTRSDLLLAALASSAASIFMTLFIVFILLLGLNGTLLYGRSAQVRQLERQSALLNSAADEMETSLQSLQSQVAELSKLSSRLAEVEEANEALRQEIEAANTQVTELNQEIDDLWLQVDAVITRTSRFQQFLDGLQDLLGGLYTPEVP